MSAPGVLRHAAGAGCCMPADDLIRSCVTVTAPGKRRKCRVPMVSMHGAYRRPCRRCLSDIDSMSPAYRGPDLYSGRGKTDAHARLSLRIQGSRSAEMSLRDKLDERWRRMRERSPLVVSFFRGGWCPFCTTELTALQQTVPDIEVRGATLVAITPDTGAALAAAKRDNALAYEVLSDLDFGVGLQFGVVFRVPDAIRDLYRRLDLDLGARHGNAHDVWLLPIPATYIVDRRGVVRYAEIDCDFRRRMEPAAIVRVLDELRAEGRSGGDGKLVDEIALPGQPDEGVKRG